MSAASRRPKRGEIGLARESRFARTMDFRVTDVPVCAIDQ